jgi:hypothetical protein
MFSIVFAIFGSVMVLIRHYVWIGRLAWMRAYHPNMMCIALAFVLSQTFCNSPPPSPKKQKLAGKATDDDRWHGNGDGINIGAHLVKEEPADF